MLLKTIISNCESELLLYYYFRARLDISNTYTWINSSKTKIDIYSYIPTRKYRNVYNLLWFICMGENTHTWCLAHGSTALSSFLSAPNACKHTHAHVQSYDQSLDRSDNGDEQEYYFIRFHEFESSRTSTPRPFTYTLVNSSEGSGGGISCKNKVHDKSKFELL